MPKNRIRFGGSDTAAMTVYTQTTPLQRHALALLRVSVELQAV